MERKEAIRILKGDTLFNSREKREALDMAISSLETDEAYQLEYEKSSRRWIEHTDNYSTWVECPVCGIERAYPTNYCPDCGAKMVEEQGENT